MNRYHMTEHFYSSVEAILLTLLMENFRISKSAKGKMEMVVIGVTPPMLSDQYISHLLY